MSSQTPLIADTVIVIQSVERYLYQVACPLLIFMGTTGCIINVAVFTQKNLRKNPYSIYFIAHNLASFIYIYSSLLVLTLSVGYRVDISGCYIVFCRLRLYMVALFDCLSPSYLIMASVDRILVTSRNATTRQRSTRRLAYICIVVGTLFWALFHSNLLIFSTIIPIDPNTYVCYYQPGIHLTFMNYFSIIKEITSLLLLSLCGLWSIQNIRSAHHIRPAANLLANRINAGGGSRANSARDRQMILMLLMDVGIYALFSFVFAVFLLYQQATQNQVKSTDRTQIETSVRNFCFFSAGIPFCLGCYTNLLVSKTFRSEVKKVFLRRPLFWIQRN